jgi:outer membrane protein
MKKLALLVSSAVLMFAMMACSSKECETTVQAKQAESFPTGTNIRYIDADSITEHYNLAKDYKEWLIKKNESLEANVKSLYLAAQRFEASCQKKAQSNGYLTEESYKADVQKYQNMITNASKKEQALRRQAAEEDAQWTQQLQDSINSYIIDYNKEHKYDAILYKAAGVYFNPTLDITNDIIEGLNSRYTKVAKKNEAKVEQADSVAEKVKK